MKASQHRFLGGVEVVRLGRTDWRINDASDPENLLGYIERQRSGRFEVMWMTDPMRWGYAETFDEAIGAFGDGLRFVGEVFDRRAAVVGRAATAGHSRRSTFVKSSRHSSVA